MPTQVTHSIQFSCADFADSVFEIMCQSACISVVWFCGKYYLYLHNFTFRNAELLLFAFLGKHRIVLLPVTMFFCLRSDIVIFAARAYARAVLGVVILSVCLSHAWIVTKLNEALQIFWYYTKGQSLCYSDTKLTVVGGRRLFPLKSALKVTHPLRETTTSTDISS